jgi:CheY-like chemotaxis protein
MPAEDSRHLRAEPKDIRSALDQLDEQAETSASALEHSGGRDSERYAYRVRAMVVEFTDAGGNWTKHTAPSRNISRTGISVLVGNFVYTGTRARVHLMSIHNHVQIVYGQVTRCRYLPGSARMHEVGIRFAQPIDLALFHRGAMEMRAMIVDADTVTSQLMSRLLGSLRMKMSPTTTAEQTTELLAQESFDFIFVAMDGPGLDGIGIVKRLRTAGYARPIVALTTGDDTQRERTYVDAGCTQFLRKPFTRESLTMVINQLRVDPIVSSLVHDKSLATLIDAFVKELHGRVLDMEKAFAAHDIAQIAAIAYWLRGSAGNHGFDMLNHGAADLETACKAEPQDIKLIRDRLSALTRLCLAARPVNSAILET